MPGVAGFGHVGYEVIPHLHLDAGLRYTWEHVDASGLEHFVVPKNSANPVAFTGAKFGWPDGSTPAKSAKGWQEASPSFSARYDIRNLGRYIFHLLRASSQGATKRHQFTRQM